MDTFSPAKRRKIMRSVRSKNTVPERIVGRMLHSFGYPHKLQCADLPGRPDFVLSGLRVAIFVHGCFWHGHHCVNSALPKSNVPYWKAKQARNIERDRRNLRRLHRMGWRTVVVWECQIRKNKKLKLRLSERLNSMGHPKTKLNWYEFFAGGGMARIGLGDVWQCTLANDWCDKKGAAYKAYFGKSEELKVQDVRSIRTTDLPGTPDMVWASFPCQDLSLAGSGAGLQGDRSGVFTPFWSLMEALIAEGRKPRLVVLENVVGAITSHEGRDFATLIRTLVRSGYRVGPLVVNAAHFLPQSRPRLFIIAISSEEDSPAGLSSTSADDVWHPPSLRRAYNRLAPTLRESWIWWRLPKPDGRLVSRLSDTIEDQPVGVEWHSQEETSRIISLMSALNRKKLESAQTQGIKRIGTIYKRTRLIGEGPFKRRVQRAEVRFDEISGCLRTPVGGSSRQIILVVEGRKVRSRLLSSREAARLMGVPEDYPIPRNYNDAYHVFGDGVAVPVVAWLEKHLLRPLALRKRFEQVA
ncbi:MAG: DNA mismatch endonuclease Vsr [Candidatus Acidiferrales bacterium]